MIKLLRFSHKDLQEVLYIYTTLDVVKDEQTIRDDFSGHDAGDMKWEDYKKLALEGVIEEIKVVEQVPWREIDVLGAGTHDGALDWIPYCTYEMHDYEGNDWALDMPIKYFLVDEERKRFMGI